MKFTVLGSGSTGNAVLIVAGETRVLVDAGLSAREIVRRLALVGEDAGSLDGIIITHEHGDHAGGLRVLLKSLNCPVYISGLTREAYISERHGVSGDEPRKRPTPCVTARRDRSSRDFKIVRSFSPFSTARAATTRFTAIARGRSSPADGFRPHHDAHTGRLRAAQPHPRIQSARHVKACPSPRELKQSIHAHRPSPTRHCDWLRRFDGRSHMCSPFIARRHNPSWLNHAESHSGTRSLVSGNNAITLASHEPTLVERRAGIKRRRRPNSRQRSVFPRILVSYNVCCRYSPVRATRHTTTGVSGRAQATIERWVKTQRRA